MQMIRYKYYMIILLNLLEKINHTVYFNNHMRWIRNEKHVNGAMIDLDTKAWEGQLERKVGGRDAP